ncbi:unnamed protein product [Brachionus calyciflorus]|uniref:Uncharacterized protein n=1 Tax=Brachionus calyciflorus TaxID=104777 RepID=A0A814E140_9BILA|nr:unnamed protein product [Brachionus calyciflorus]
MNRELRIIIDIDVNNIEKRYKPSKYYVYCIWVTWSDKNQCKIYRRYSQFFDLQCRLLDKFKRESGFYDPNERIIPFLPGKKIFGRSQISSVALQRMYQINAYCKRLIKLKPDISQSDLVIKFFELSQDDIFDLTSVNSLTEQPDISTPLKSEDFICMHDFKPESKSEIKIRKTQIVQVLEKNENGWWFVNTQDGQGFVPQSVLKPLNKCQNNLDLSIPVEPNEYFIVKKDYKANKNDEITIEKGEFIKVLEKKLNGWWTVEYKGEIGLAPGVCIGQLNKLKLDKELIFTVDTKSMTSFESFDSLENSLGNNEEFYYVLEDYVDSMGEGLSLKKGQKCRVLNKENSSGWWYVQIEGFENCEGWAPNAYLTKDKIKPPRPPKPQIQKHLASDKTQALNIENLIENNDKPVYSVSKMRELFEQKF